MDPQSFELQEDVPSGKQHKNYPQKVNKFSSIKVTHIMCNFYLFYLLTALLSYGNIDSNIVILRKRGKEMTSIYKYEHPYVCTDAVVFRINTEATDNYRKLPEASLSVLLYQRESEPFKGLWSLPGGFLNIDETPEDNIRRKLASKSLVTDCYLEQLYTFCDIDRDPRGRVISVAYLGLMTDNASEGDWFTVKVEGETLTLFNESNILTEASLSFDHYCIIKTALDRLRAKLSYTDLIFNLLPEEFTLRQLQNVYEVVQGKEELTANFRRKIAHMVKETNRYTADKGHRPAQLYVKA